MGHAQGGGWDDAPLLIDSRASSFALQSRAANFGTISRSSRWPAVSSDRSRVAMASRNRSTPNLKCFDLEACLLLHLERGRLGKWRHVEPSTTAFFGGFWDTTGIVPGSIWVLANPLIPVVT
jgi:hypothetical protein